MPVLSSDFKYCVLTVLVICLWPVRRNFSIIIDEILQADPFTFCSRYRDTYQPICSGCLIIECILGGRKYIFNIVCLDLFETSAHVIWPHKNIDERIYWKKYVFWLLFLVIIEEIIRRIFNKYIEFVSDEDNIISLMKVKKYTRLTMRLIAIFLSKMDD